MCCIILIVYQKFRFMNFDVEGWFQRMSNGGEIVMSYKGDITSEIITNVLEEIEHKLEEAQEESKVKKRVYYVLVEALQNLYHHKDEIDQHKADNNDKFFSLFLISKDDKSYKITTGNFVEKDKTDMLTPKECQITFIQCSYLRSLQIDRSRAGTVQTTNDIE